MPKLLLRSLRLSLVSHIDLEESGTKFGSQAVSFAKNE